ncbi:MAG: hypothetical protein C0618_04890 [Desulfuromonas sp.]|nr:MAG: hypothetical protein C0618_04890 [Desulfuromonas sp.]
MSKPETAVHRTVHPMAMHSTHKQLSTPEYRALSADQRIDVIRAAEGKKKVDLILDAPDAEQLVPQLHPQEIYMTVYEVGTEYAAELMMLISPEQLTTLLDLDCWDNDVLNEEIGLHWLQVILETGEDKICQTVHEIDLALLALFLKKQITITRGPEAYDDDDAENANRLEGLYDIAYNSELSQKIISALLGVLIKCEPSLYVQLLELVRGEMGSTLEEEIFQDRSRRLLDLGLMSLTEARSLYSYVDPQTFRPRAEKQPFHLESDTLQSPVALLSQAQPENLLAEILAAGLTHEQATELAMLANRKMCADQVDLSDKMAVSESMAQMYQTLNLALESLASGSVSEAEKLFKTCYLIELFQYGHSLVESLKNAAGQLLAKDVALYLDAPYQRFLTGLCQTPPKLCPGERLTRYQDKKPLQTVSDLTEASRILQQITIQEQLFSGLLPFGLPSGENQPDGELLPEDESLPTLSDLFLTALANRLLGRNFLPTPLSAADVPQLYALICTDKQIAPALHQDTCAFLDNLLPGGGQFGEFCLHIWQEEICPVDIADIDPRFVRGLLFA